MPPGITKSTSKPQSAMSFFLQLPDSFSPQKIPCFFDWTAVLPGAFSG